MDAIERRRVFLWVWYEGPWERLATWFWGISRRTNDFKGFEVPDGCLRDKIATWCDNRDTAWRNRYAASGRFPPRWWRR